MFSSAVVSHLVVPSSDHMGLLVNISPPPVRNTQRQQKLFRFEHTWLREDGYEQTINDAWQVVQNGTDMFKLA